jgi:hypothetical protein
VPGIHADPQIAAGVLDLHPSAIAEAVRARSEPLHAVSSTKALARFQVDARVRINHRVSPPKLHGILETIVDIDDRTATICIHRRAGRFESGEIRCPPLALDLLPPPGRSSRTGGRTLARAPPRDPTRSSTA